MPKTEVSLATLDSGGAVEKFDLVLREVLQNIMDTNTDATFVREITLKVKIKPSEDRQIGAIHYEVTSKEAGIKGGTTTFYFEQDSLGPRATERPKAQEKFNFGALDDRDQEGGYPN